MRMIDPDRDESIQTLQLYLTESKAIELVEALNRLLKDPEANNHFHISSQDMATEISCSIFTKRKFKENHYTKLEIKILKEL